MTGTYAGQFVMRGFWDFSLPPWQQVLITRCLAILPALSVCFLASPCDYTSGCVDLLSTGEVNTNLDMLNMYINVMQSIQLPFALLPLLTFTCDPNVVKTYRNSLGITILIWALTFLLIFVNYYQCSVFLEMLPDSVLVWLGVAILVIAYTAVIIYLVVGPNYRNIELARRTYEEIEHTIREYTRSVN
jgi:Mn2+/Fe2+ NRAMP family transporter